MLKVAYKKVGEDVKLVEIGGSLNELNDMLEGYLEAVPFWTAVPYREQEKFSHLIMLINEEGKLRDLSPNIKYGSYDVIVGNLIVCSHDGSGEFESISEQDFENIKEVINKYCFIG